MVARTHTAIIVAALLLIAGCSSSGTPATTTPTPETATTTTTTELTTHTPTRTTTTTRRTTTAPTTTTTPPPQNPWRQNTVVVGIQHNNQSTVPERHMRALQQTVDYWNGNVSKYSVFEDVQFVVNADAAQPDVQVAIVENLTVCANSFDPTYVGCADIYESGEVEYGSSYVRIEDGYTYNSTLSTMKHEFGHLLGISHGSAPMPTMAATADTVRVSVRNASSRNYPWTETNLTVAVTGSPTDTQRTQIEHALQYMADGADGYFESRTPSFRYVENASTADIVIRASGNQWACGKEYADGSCVNYWGYDEDVDEVLEYYSRLKITLASTDSESTGYHVAYWLVRGFGAEGDEVPAPLDNEDDNPRSEWWN